MRLNSHILDIIEGQCPKGRLLDVGCGCGFFIKAAKNRNWSILGIDPSEESVANARKLVGNAALTGTLSDTEIHDTFDVVTLINVVDIMKNPCDDLTRIKNHLRPGGLLFLRVPNGLFHGSMIRFRSAMTEKPILNPLLVFHEYVFTPAFIGAMLKNMGFDHIVFHNPLLAGTAFFQHKPLSQIFGKVVKCFFRISYPFFKSVSRNHLHIGPSLEVTAVRRNHRGMHK